jgi:hypothetical protein
VDGGWMVGKFFCLIGIVIPFLERWSSVEGSSTAQAYFGYSACI